ncbi:winged helix-turn-helix domain-containing protein [soil metagenome]
METSGTHITISGDVARRYLLGRQGLWPGRRWTGKGGARRAIHGLESVQVDSMTVVARSHDLVLWSRVEDYVPEHLDGLLYQDRQFFDYGGNLNIYPMTELPYWRLHMRRRFADERRALFVAEYGTLLDEVRAEVQASGPLGNRDFKGSVRVASYRARKDTGLALYYLWLTGELMTHSRRGFERLYDLRERIVPAEFDYEATQPEAERYFAAKAIRQQGLGTLRSWTDAVAYFLHQRMDRAATRTWMDELVASGEAVSVAIQGHKEPYYMPATDVPLLAGLDAGLVPDTWRALDSTTQTEVNFLSPLDNVLARKRTQALFNFEYIWEVYKPADRRRWGYYTMPVLYGDRLVARIDPKLDRKTGTLWINGFWLEDETTADDSTFAEALARGLGRFAHFHEASRVELESLFPVSLRDRVRALIAV